MVDVLRRPSAGGVEDRRRSRRDPHRLSWPLYQSVFRYRLYLRCHLLFFLFRDISVLPRDSVESPAAHMVGDRDFIGPLYLYAECQGNGCLDAAYGRRLRTALPSRLDRRSAQLVEMADRGWAWLSRH